MLKRVSKKLINCIFSLCETLCLLCDTINYTEDHRDGTENHRVFGHLPVHDLTNFSYEQFR